MHDGIAVFFDIGDTLASPVVDSGRLTGLRVYPFVPEVLRRLRSRATVALGLISDTGEEPAANLAAVLAEAGLAELVNAPLCLFSSVEGMDKSQPAFFTLAVTRAALPAGRCVFVGESAAERAVAEQAGLRVSFHPLHALHLVEHDLLAG